MTLKDSFDLAFRTVRSNRLRTGITVAIIAFGIMALIGIITAIQAMNEGLRNSFSTMRSVLLVLKTNALLSFVPKKFVDGLVPLLPVMFQFCAFDVVAERKKQQTGKNI